MDLFIFQEFKLNMYFEVLNDDALIRVLKFLSKQKPSIVLQISEIRKEFTSRLLIRHFVFCRRLTGF